MGKISRRRFDPQRGAALYFQPYPYAELEDFLKLVGRVVPTVVVAYRMSRQVVVGDMSATAAVCQDVVSLPPLGDNATANVAAAIGLGQDQLPLLP